MDFTPYLGLISETVADCYPQPTDTDANNSDDTILYLSSVAELPLSRLGLKEPYKIMGQVRSDASDDLNADLKAFLPVHFPAQSRYSTGMGSPSHTQFVLPAGGIARLPLPMPYRRGGVVKIVTLGMRLSEGVTNQVIDLVNLATNTVLKTTTKTIEPNTNKQVALPAWELPMDGGQYELRAQLPPGVKVGNNSISCGCSSMRYLPNLITNCCTGKANGFMLTLSGDCNYDSLLEQLMQNDRTRLVLANMLAYKAAYRLCVGAISGKVERSTVLSETDLSNAAARCDQNYLNRLNWLKAEVLKLDLVIENSCYKAAKPFGWSRSGLFTN